MRPQSQKALTFLTSSIPLSTEAVNTGLNILFSGHLYNLMKDIYNMSHYISIETKYMYNNCAKPLRCSLLRGNLKMGTLQGR